MIGKLKTFMDHPFIRMFEMGSTVVGLVSFISTFFEDFDITNILAIGERVLVGILGINAIVIFIFFILRPIEWRSSKKKGRAWTAAQVFLPEFTRTNAIALFGRNFIAIVLISLVETFPDTFTNPYPEPNDLGLMLILPAYLIIGSWYITAFRVID